MKFLIFRHFPPGVKIADWRDLGGKIQNLAQPEAKDTMIFAFWVNILGKKRFLPSIPILEE
jgi:hypothetical protein